MINLGISRGSYILYSDEQDLVKYGFRWQNGSFRFPFSIAIVDKLLQEGYELDSDIMNYYNEEKLKLRPKRYFPQADLKLPLLPFQKEGMDFILRTGSCILADQMGLGKTPTSLAVCEYLGCKTLVLTRAALIDQWADEIEKFTQSSYVAIHSDKNRATAWKRAIRLPDHYVVASYDMMRSPTDIKYASEYLAEDSAIIYDEITMLKNASTKRSKAISRLKPELL